MPKPIERESLTDKTVDALISLIEERELSAGDALPSTADLANDLAVSRPVVREAIAELAGQGLLERRQGRETVITLPGARQLERLIRLRFAIHGDRLEDIQEYREVAEVGAARLAAARATKADVEAIRGRLEAMRGITNENDLHEADQQFHREVARVADNEMLLLALDGITPLLHQLRVQAWRGWKKSGHGVEPIIDAHSEILDQIAARNPDGAAKAMAEHLQQARTGLEFGRTSRDSAGA